MTKLYAPPGALEEARQDEAELMAQVFQDAVVRETFEPDLKLVDPALELRKAQDTVAPGSALKPGFWHIIRHESGFLSKVTPLEWPDGTYREPGSWIYAHLAEEDMWSNRSRKARRERREKLQAAQTRERKREAQDRAGDFDERWHNANRGQILVSRDI